MSPFTYDILLTSKVICKNLYYLTILEKCIFVKSLSSSRSYNFVYNCSNGQHRIIRSPEHGNALFPCGTVNPGIPLFQPLIPVS